METRETALRIIGTLAGGGFLLYAAVAVVRGTVYDVEDGHINRRNRPITFWLLLVSMSILGLTILGVGWRWPIMGTIYQAIGPR